MQFSIKRLFILTVIVAWMFGQLGRYWPVGAAMAAMVSVTSGIVLLTFGTIKSWKLVAWTCAVFLGSLLSVRAAVSIREAVAPLRDCSQYTVDAIVLLVGAILSGVAAAALLMLVPARTPPSPPDEAAESEC